MAIQKWRPFSFNNFGGSHDFDDLFSRFFAGRPSYIRANSEHEAWSIPLDVVQEGDELVVTASVPGTTKDDIEVSVDDNVLTIRAETSATTESTDDESGDYLLRERRTGNYYRSLRLPETVDFENAVSTFKDGVLSIRLPKLESKKTRKLEISAV